ncbi:DUF393 domain-containing protein [Flammeovirga yaeyamensis]|uniref:DUF393 domain-containing protein n=1 Tax=Flammeovirga yaeyamensis TaxID=367791 RepID=A0AAX1NAN2_9BACT|nr:DCC1-like thiol-disulfide oxidoreductase family protein [Flammeovirga yaeyamensis]MBB3699102.1 putative DCC family thiol-disulfide oxidoreductase YuxK [Flammeovirga yaeyamensis]NMF36536.1 DUF393 domain-containing protein [Flammeovirga yaeyamensis]QWG03506.1 DUF393 domain-containing protein [Flammeovirga yaeyamensis]
MDKKVILFDGICNLCDKSVQFIIRHEKSDTFQFASLQSDEGKSLLNKYNLNPDYIDSIVLVTDQKAYTKSRAALEIAKDLKSPFHLFRFGTIFPIKVTDLIYDLIAKYRYRLFGKKEDTCELIHQQKKFRGTS